MVNAKLSENVRIKIVNIPFHHFMHSPPLEVNSYLLDDIISRYIGNNTFRLGNKELVCTNEDFEWILSLPYHGNKVDIREFSKYHKTFYDKRLHKYELSR